MYYVQIDGLNLPFAPSTINTKIKGKNKTIDLIDEGEVNILKKPGLTEISFTARIPQVQYPFATRLIDAKTYTDKFESLKINRKPFKLIISRWRGSHDIKSLFHTQFNVSLEDYSIKEDAKEGFDLLIDLKFKEYREYSTIIYEPVPTVNETVAVETVKFDETQTNGNSHTVVSGDTLCKIARQYYGGNGDKWELIYNANKTTIENAAKKYGKKSSANGWWIYPGTVLNIPSNK